jgi:N-acyl-D-amino-acid deacylase
MRAQVAPRPVGMFYGLDLSFHPFAYHPSYKDRAPAAAERVARMQDPHFRAQLLSEQPEDTNTVNVKTVKSFQYAYVWGEDANYEPELADRIDQRAKAAGLSVEEYAYDLLLANDGKAIFYQPGANYRDAQPGCGARNARPSAIGGRPGRRRRALRHDLRRQLPHVASWPAGRATPARRSASAAAGDCRADQRTRHARRPERPGSTGGRSEGRYQCDRPLAPQGACAHGGARPACRRAAHAPAGSGYVATIVSGKVTYRNGEHTGELPGRLVRGPQETPLVAA